MICEECGDEMVWRCTNNITRVGKFKCKGCGHIQTAIVEEPEPIPEKVPNFYFEKNGSWIVKKTINKEKVYIGSFRSEELARKVSLAMQEVGWDKSLVPDVFRKLGIQRIGRSWVAV